MPAMNSAKPAQWAAILGAALLSGCAASERIVKVFEDPNFDAGPFTRILVVGVHEDAGIRRQFENSLVAAMNTTGPAAVASLSLMSADDPIERDRVVAAARETAADAVLITRLLDSESTTTVQGRQSAGAEAVRRNDIALADFFRYDYVEYQDPMSITTVRTVVLSTDLYNVADENKIWSVESTSFDKGSVYGLIDGSSRSITDQLRRDGLIP